MTTSSKQSQVESFMAAVTAPDERKSLLLDRLLDDMDDTIADTVRTSLEDLSISVTRIVNGLQSIDIQISSSSVDTWRKRHGIK